MLIALLQNRAYAADVATVGGNLTAERERRGLTQAALAAALGKSQGQVSGWEKGRRFPEAQTITRIAAALSKHGPPCSPKELLAGVVTPYDALRGSTTPTAPVSGRTATQVEAEKIGKRILDLPDVFRELALDYLKMMERRARSANTRRASGG